MTDPTERALALASEVLPAHEYLRPTVARVIQGVMDERDKLHARDQRIRALAARVGTDESLIPAIPNLLDAIEEAIIR